MATTSETVVVDRDYVDNFSIKDYAKNNLIDKYFSDIDPSLRTVGMIGYTTEQVANISEDVFNTASVLFRETFPNRAKLPESIYSHAALFQLSDSFSSASACTFLLVLEESAIVTNMQTNYDKDTGIYHFYIDKNTVIYVEDIPYTLDYDIEIKVVKKSNDLSDDYIFSASYIISEYSNSISTIKDPYIKIRRSSDGYIALEVKCHQCIRTISYETILTNSTINYPTIDITLDGDIAGFDILYKTSTEKTYSTQLTPLVIYSQPITKPFCYYEMADEDVLRITFNTKDDYFSPEYGSEFMIILYNTKGAAGNFDVYTGTDISIVPSEEKYTYVETYLSAAKPMTSSSGGADKLSIEALQALTIQGFRTANALTTESDLAEYFSNYKYLYGNSEILFIKKRDDIFERVYSAFIIMKQEDYIYKTNTMNLSTNISEMQNPEETIYTLEPGLLFVADNDNPGFADFLRDSEKNALYYAEYLQAIEDGTIPYIEDADPSTIPDYLDRPASFAEFKRRKGVDDKLSVFDYNSLALDQYDNPQSGKFLYINPFLIRFKKNPNLISMYMTYINQKSMVDFTSQNTDSFVQFIMYQLQVQRDFSDKKNYKFTLNLLPSISVSDDYPVINKVETGDVGNNGVAEKEYVLGDKYAVVDNDLRVLLVINDGIKNICYTEFYPTAYDIETGTFTFNGEIRTDDHITSEGKLRILPNTIYRNETTGEYYKVYDNDSTLYNRYDSDDTLLESDIPVDIVTGLINDGTLKKWSETVNMTTSNDILIPMSDITCKIYTIYRRLYSEIDGKLNLATDEQTNNLFASYDTSYNTYIWTNEYSTASDPLTFMKPLNNVRSTLEFKDYTLTETVVDPDDQSETVSYIYDIMDMDMLSLPFLRWSIIKDTENLSYFMSSFMSQYNNLIDIINTSLRGQTSIDVKFYNTYGMSKNFSIGETSELLSTVNLSLSFDIWFITGTDLLSAIPEIKEFIKTEVETINVSGMNSLYISNLMRKIESTYAYVDHIRFNSINGKPSTYQAVKNNTVDLSELTVEERRLYVPELLVIDTADITINDYYA